MVAVSRSEGRIPVIENQLQEELLLNTQIGTLSPCLKLRSGKSKGITGTNQIGRQSLPSVRLGVRSGMVGDICTAA
jgi:hypothetical protein